MKRMKLPPRLRTAGLVLAALALPVVLAAATWTITTTGLGTSVGVDDQRQSGPATPVTSAPTATTARPAPATTGPPASTCDEPGDDRCAGGDDDSGRGGDDDGGGRGRNRGRGGGGDD